MKPRVEESGLYFDCPQGDCFRLQDAAYFQDQFKRHGLAEMDFGWRDERALWLLELKDYSWLSAPAKKGGTALSADTLKERRAALPQQLVEEFCQKATDCVLLLGSVWHGLPHAEGIGGCLPEAWHKRPAGDRELRLAFVVKADDKGLLATLGPMQDRLRNKLAGRLQVFNLRAVVEVLLMDHRSAQRMGVPIVAVEEAG